MKRLLLSGLAALTLLGCTPAAAPVPTAPAPAAAPVAVTIPAEPFWGPPGTTVIAEGGGLLSQSLEGYGGALLARARLAPRGRDFHVIEWTVGGGLP